MKHIFLPFKHRKKEQASILDYILQKYMGQKSIVVACMCALWFSLDISVQAQGPASHWDKAIPGMVCDSYCFIS